MNHLEKMSATVAIILFMLCTNQNVKFVSGADECRSSNLKCYECDSRRDPYCGDPFNSSLPYELRPAIKDCVGCCIKIIHKFPHGQWIQRTCTENIIINYFIVDHVCLKEGKGRGKMCFCEENLCNRGTSQIHFSSTLFFSFILMTLIFMHLQDQIFM